MRKLLYVGLTLVAVLYLLPTVYGLLGGDDSLAIDFEQLDLPGAVPVSEAQAGQSAQPAQTDGANSTNSVPADHSTVTVLIEGQPTKLPLETYVAGVTAAEISSDFPEAALRAQAVAARTYAVYKIDRGRPDVHPDADVCDDYHHCAAYRDAVAAAAADSGYDRILQAVRDTEGQIVTYGGEPIAAVFHCASGPRTEAAQDVWGGDAIPYLKSVVSPGGADCAKYAASVTVSADEFRQKVKETFPTADVSGAPRTWFKASERTEAGSVKTVKVGGVTVEGTAVRELFGLNSANFTITTEEDSITFHTIGYGHGVGLSQYGAKYLAETGDSFEEILSHYYPGTTLQSV